MLTLTCVMQKHTTGGCSQVVCGKGGLAVRCYIKHVIPKISLMQRIQSAMQYFFFLTSQLC